MDVEYGRTGQRNRNVVRFFESTSDGNFMTALDTQPNDPNRWVPNRPDRPYIPYQVHEWSIRIPTILHLGLHQHDINSIDYFVDTARKHIGCHVFLKQRGKLVQNLCYFDHNNRYEATRPAPISAVYPNMRPNWYDYHNHPNLRNRQNRERTTPAPQLLLGLDFLSSQRNHERDYRRYGTDTLFYGGVNEITEQYLWNVYENRNNQYCGGTRDNRNADYFGIYVCAGAKLVVIDDCNEQKVDPHSHTRPHNRSLLQQGSIVLVEGRLQFEVPIEIGYQYAFQSYDINQIESAGIFPPPLPRVSDKRNPFLFLGAIESEHNSIAWELRIIEATGNQPKCGVLMIPEGGRIMGIEEWNRGIEEIYFRHGFERLFESIVKPTNIQSIALLVPEWDLFERIFNYTTRPFTCRVPVGNRYQLNPPYRPPYPLPRNWYDFEQKLVEKRADIVHQNPIPPLYPPLLINDCVLYMPRMDPTDPQHPFVYPIFDADQPDMYLTFNNVKFQRNDVYLLDYQWDRSLQKDIFFIKYDQNYRIGVDHELYEKRGAIGVMHSFVYVPMYKHVKFCTQFHWPERQ